MRGNGIDLETFQKLPSPSAFRAQHTVPAGVRLILYMGRISPVKNLKQLILAFHQAHIPNTRLILMGPSLEPEYESQLQKLIKMHGLCETVQLLGPLYGDSKLAALAAADLFVLPSLSESYGNAAAEAVAAGIPVLLTDRCGIAPLIHEKAGLAVALGVESLADGLRQMLENTAP